MVFPGRVLRALLCEADVAAPQSPFRLRRAGLPWARNRESDAGVNGPVSAGLTRAGAMLRARRTSATSPPTWGFAGRKSNDILRRGGQVRQERGLAHRIGGARNVRRGPP